MTKRWKKAVRSLLLLALSALLATFAAAAELMPYDGYTYDFWGDSIPSLAGYMPGRIYSGGDMGCGDITGGEDLFVYGDRLYLLDSGSKSVLILDENYRLAGRIEQFLYEDGSEYLLQDPKGLYIRDDRLYIADKGSASGNQSAGLGDPAAAGRVIRCTLDGKIDREYTRPDTALLDSTALFKPVKVVADAVGNCYVLCEDLYQGLVNYDKDGDFTAFFGGNQVQLSSNQLMAYFWKKILTREQAQKMIRFLPVEYTNAFIVGDFIYTVTKTNTNSVDEIQKLNPIGRNVLHFSETDAAYPKNNFGDVETAYFKQTLYDSQLVDIHVDEDDLITVLDFERGRLFQYDQECNIVAVFGSKGSQKGNFLNPTAVEKFAGSYVVLDKAKRCLTTFQETEYMQHVRQGIRYYQKNLNTESLEEVIEPWEKVLSLNSGYRLAYLNIGRALSQQGRYEEALEYFKLAQNREEYSQAFRQVRTQFVKRTFVWILLGAAAFLVLLVWTVRFVKRKLGFESKRTKMIYH